MSYSTIFAVIEGAFGDDPLTYPDGLALYTGEEPNSVLTALDYEWQPLLVDVPTPAATEAEPLECVLVAGSITLSIRRTDAIEQALTSRKRFNKYLSTAVTRVATSVQLAQTSAVSTGSVLYIGDECMIVTTDSGSGLLQVDRGALGTKAKAHAAGAFVSVNQPSFMRTRRVTLYSTADDGTPERRWQGLIDSVRKENYTIKISCRVDPAFWNFAGLNKDSHDLSSTGKVWLSGRVSDADGSQVDTSQIYGTVYTVGLQTLSSRVFKADTANNSPVAMRVGDALTIGIARGVNSIDFPSVPSLLGTKFKSQESGSWSDGPSGYYEVDVEGPIREIFLVSRAVDNWAIANLGEAVSATRELDYPYHPLSIACALLFSDESSTADVLSFNVLNGEYYGADYISQTESGILNTVTALIEATPDLMVDTVELGWDGETVDLWEFVSDLLPQFGFYVTVDEFGRTGFGRVGLIDVSEYSGAEQITIARVGDPALAYAADDTRSIESLILNVGRRAWAKPRQVTVGITGTTDRRQSLGVSASKTLELSAYDASRFTELKETFSRLAILFYEAPPRLSLTVAATEGESYGIGDVKILPANLPIWQGETLATWLVDRTGIATDDADAEGFTGRVVSTQWLPKQRSYALTIEMQNFHVGALVKLRAPSMVVTGVANDGAKTTITCSGTSEFGGTVADNTWFRANDAVEFFEPNGVINSGNPLNYGIESVGTNSVTFSGILPDEAGLVGTIMRLSYVGSGGWANSGAYLTGIARPWAYFGTDESAVDGADLVEVYEATGDIYG